MLPHNPGRPESSPAGCCSYPDGACAYRLLSEGEANGTAPVFAGVFPTEKKALNAVLNDQPLEAFTHQREVERFDDGTDTFADQPLCFAAPDGIRKFSPRRAKLVEGRG
ncbi:MAG: hypothetical protein ACREXR_11725 [Gammaproteobacteria bacterium]